MRIFNKFKGTKGWITTYDRVLRFRDMITQEAQRRAGILTFWQKHGLEAVTEAFGVKRRTLFDWQSRLKAGQGPGKPISKPVETQALILTFMDEKLDL